MKLDIVGTEMAAAAVEEMRIVADLMTDTSAAMAASLPNNK